MQERNRSYRRKVASLKKQAVRRYGVAGYWWNGDRPVTDKRVIGMVATTPKACGCWMCANHTLHHGERFADVRKKEQFDVALGLSE